MPAVDKGSDIHAVSSHFAELWVKDGSAEAFNGRAEANPDAGFTHQRVPPVAIGIFGGAGWAPDYRNALDQCYSAGIGGYGMFIPRRDND
jgi:hypothetical protein